MGTIILPDHHLIRHPTIMRRNVPPILVSGGVISDEGDFKLVTFYRRAAPHVAEEWRTIAMTHDDFALSLLVASIDFLPAVLRGFRMTH